MDHHLKTLGDSGGELAAVLDLGEGEAGDYYSAGTGDKGGGEDAGGSYGILDGEVDANAADGGHGVGGVADTEEAGAVPVLEAVDLNGEELDLVPVGELVYTVGEERNEARERGAEGLETGRLDVGGEGVLCDEEAALEVVAAVDEDQEGAVVDVAESVDGIGFTTAETEPENVDGDARLVDPEMGGGAGRGVATVAANYERGVDFGGAGGRVDADAGDTGAGFDEAGYFVFHEEMEAGEMGGLGGEEVEKVPLGHEGDELCVGREMGRVGNGKGLATDGETDFGDLLVGEGEEGFEDA
jgi:hypothetical protein